MKKLEMNGKIFAATIKESGKVHNRIYIWEIKIESLSEFAKAVVAEIESVFPKYSEIWVSAYGDAEADPIIEIDKDYDEFYIIGQEGQ